MTRAEDGVRIVPLGDEHVAPACAIYGHWVEHSTATFHERILTPDEFAGMVRFADPRHAAFAAVQGERVVGYGLVAPYNSRCGYADAAEVAIYLAPDRTGRGLGSEILARLERHACSAGMHVLIAGACTENVASLRLFERAGWRHCALFREVGWKFGRRLDVAYLQKVLPARAAGDAPA